MYILCSLNFQFIGFIFVTIRTIICRVLMIYILNLYSCSSCISLLGQLVQFPLTHFLPSSLRIQSQLLHLSSCMTTTSLNPYLIYFWLQPFSCFSLARFIFFLSFRWYVLIDAFTVTVYLCTYPCSLVLAAKFQFIGFANSLESIQSFILCHAVPSPFCNLCAYTDSLAFSSKSSIVRYKAIISWCVKYICLPFIYTSAKI